MLPRAHRYLQSSGKAENAVRTVEPLFTKCRVAGISEFQVLLDWRNTPSEGMDRCPAQASFGSPQSKRLLTARIQPRQRR